MVAELKKLIDQKNRAGLMGEALPLLEQLVRAVPDDPEVRLQHGHALRTAGRSAEAIDAYRRALAMNPRYGEVWWALANLKTMRFDESDVAAMEDALAAGLDPRARIAVLFALGKAYEDSAEPATAFAHYRSANQLKRQGLRYNPDALTRFVGASRDLFTAEFFSARAKFGNASSAPIFVLGMPRSGSTLVEQILASHPAVASVGEPNSLGLLSSSLGQGQNFLDKVASLKSRQAFELARKYLNEVPRARTQAPRFVDKQPLNWLWTGLIHLILPKARIIDVRRHPLDCCWSNFRQNFAVGVPFIYDMHELGRYYRDYTVLMAGIDAALPGRVHRIFYERLVHDPEAEVRKLLDYLHLDFDPACLRFYENARHVQTPSSEQVRQPITSGGIGHHKQFQPWLDPLQEALGTALSDYPS
ncbi:MAG: sulfotransferase [Sphingomicrobium sp.]